MAILFVPENQYWKIDYDKSYISGQSVFVKLIIYKNEAERNKEKAIEEQIAYFKAGITREIKDSLDYLATRIEEKGYTIDIPETDTEYWQADDFSERLRNTFKRILERLYIVGGAEMLPEITIDNDIKEILDKYSFSLSWINDPILITGELFLNCGEYNDEEITPEFYYQKLKQLIDKEIIDLL